MEWTEEAMERLDRVPRLIRRMVKNRVEEHSRRKGVKNITSAEVEEAKSDFLKKGSKKGRVKESFVNDLERMVEAAEKEGLLKTRYYEVKGCGGMSGCPFTQFDVAEMSESVRDAIEASGFPGYMEAGMEGRPILSHHRFKVSINGCPNNCAGPQVVDFGIVGQLVPETGGGECNQCMRCVKVCREEAIEITGDGPVFDMGLCVNCGECAGVCPRDSIVISQRGLLVMAGGKLGRRPRLATTLSPMCGEREVMGLLDSVLGLLMAQQTPTRLGVLMDHGETVT